MTLNLAETSVARSRPSVPRVANLCSEVIAQTYKRNQAIALLGPLKGR